MFEELERITYHPDDHIFKEGDEGDCAYLIENGSVELSTLQKKEIIKILSLHFVFIAGFLH